ncbi:MULTISPECIES: carboxymuconolactone decarboxylase family protein [unclassified Methanoculleus]|jgi:AhpD family alkylhydroperoxidase|uniref:carboxymuconolactone decarboxylase family protein n=1 Tax=unclassified Methanoculleus TaxID=2619537 RepID=UPI0025CDF2B6|nr:carboxymuconolactone decarboxylase family protein [Methanoculleus sp. UBA303]MCE5337363.1 carboxymuconolactone decarboxylase family protein [Methanomicrobiaceae archaeon]MDD3933412.1 carboxymuconolactone decarboxylase family protein [Methanoculleus sp.]
MDFEKILTRVAERGSDVIAGELLREIEAEYGRVPLIFERMAERPEILISHLLYKGAVVETSQLEPKTIELISLAVGAALKCSHCVEYHMQSAMAKGATRAEILEVILIAGMLANSAVLADAYRVVNGSTPCAPCDINGTGLDKTCSDE